MPKAYTPDFLPMMICSAVRFLLYNASLAVLLACVLAGPAWAQPRAEAVPTRATIAHQAQKQAGPKQPKHAQELNSQEMQCILNMLHAHSVAEAKEFKGKCTDSFTLRATYASLLVKFHAPRADQAIIANLPESASEMDQLFSFAYDFEDPAPFHAYNHYYHAIFRIVAARPQLLPRFFAIAAQFGTDNPNVDEETWFCQVQERLYKRMPKAYMKAVKATTDPYYRRVALDCRSGPL